MNSVLKLSPHVVTAAACLVHWGTGATAGDLTVTVSGVKGTQGVVVCVLHAGSASFPNGNGSEVVTTVAPDPAGVTCVFPDVTPGQYTVAAMHDTNGNGQPDTNALGIPSEPWGMSNGVRPRLRAPRFDEASFPVTDQGGRLTITVK